MDLTTGLMALASAAADRRHARRDLIEATDVVAREITKHLRSDDSVYVNGHFYRIERLSWVPQNPFAAPMATGPASVLTRDGFALHDERRSNGEPAPDTYYVRFGTQDQVRFADADVRAEFAEEAAGVIVAFAAHLDTQNRRYDEAARSIVSLRPR